MIVKADSIAERWWCKTIKTRKNQMTSQASNEVYALMWDVRIANSSNNHDCSLHSNVVSNIIMIMGKNMNDFMDS